MIRQSRVSARADRQNHAVRPNLDDPTSVVRSGHEIFPEGRESQPGTDIDPGL